MSPGVLSHYKWQASGDNSSVIKNHRFVDSEETTMNYTI